MSKSPTSKLRALLTLLVLVIGPLQAQNVFACSMMDGVFRGDCCCVGSESDRDCMGANCDTAVESTPDPCCERSVQVSIDHEARQDAPVVKPVEIRSDVDPPPAHFASFGAIVPPPSRAANNASWFIPVFRHSGSDTYLLTQRLRI